MARYQFIIEKLKEIGYHDNCFVVDCACGQGHGSLLLQNVGFKVKGFDVSPKVISKYAVPLGIDAEHANIRKLPLDNDSVDIFVCSETLEHLKKKNVLEATNEIKRVCKDDALICITVPLYVISLRTERHKQYITINEIIEWFREFDIVFYGACNLGNCMKPKGSLVVILRKSKDES